MTPRHRRRLGVLVGIALLVPLFSASAAAASPVDDKRQEAARIQAQIDAQAQRESILDEQYNQARLKVTANEAALAKAQAELADANNRFAEAKVRMGRYAVHAYTSGGSASVIEQLAKSDGADMVIRRHYLDTAAADERQAIDGLKAARQDLNARQAGLQSTQKAVNAAAQEVGAQRSALEKLGASQRATLAKVNGEIGSLLAQEQAARQAAQARQAQAVIAAGPSTPAPVMRATATTASRTPSSLGRPASGPGLAPGASSAPVPSGSGGGTAVAAARSQIGKPYQWGGAGPDSYDCSGLTMFAWGQAGVSLPHSSDAQYASTTHVSASEMQPGDLIFWSGHEAMYSGGGMMIEAAHSGTNVREVPVRGGFFGVGRPG